MSFSWSSEGTLVRNTTHDYVAPPFQDDTSQSEYVSAESEHLTQETERIQKDCVKSSRRALSRVYDALGIATASLTTINDQSEQLFKVERNLRDSKYSTKVNL
jgi:uncharacterized protein YoxC